MKARNALGFVGQFNRLGRHVVFMLFLSILYPAHLGAQPLLLSYFKFNGDGLDSLGNSPPMQLANVSFADGTMVFPNTTSFTANAVITGFSYSSFTVSFDFRPDSFGYPHETLLSGGPSYRWIGLQNDALGHLQLSLNNGNLLYPMTNLLTANHWHTLVCSVDLPSQTILIMLDGEILPAILLQNFQFEVVGTSFEESDKAFTFWNYSNAESLSGQADNLRVYSRALAASEMQSMYSVNIGIEDFGQGAIISWPADLTGYVAEFANSLTPPISWQVDARTPLTVGDQNVLVDAPATGTRFYRLRRQ